MKAVLALEDGTVYEGSAFGSRGETTGEVVFNTSMTGYQEVLTDPSYAGQMVVMTYPLIGNYGITDEDFESGKAQVAGYVVREYSAHFSNWRATRSLGDFLEKHGVIGIEGVDTRALTRRLRTRGVMKGVLSTETDDPAELVRRAQSSPPMVGMDWVKAVTCDESFPWKDDAPAIFAPRKPGSDLNDPQLALNFDMAASAPPVKRYHVVAFDFGMKRNILRLLVHHGCDVTVVPANTSAETVLNLKPDGIFLSNGPGDPEAVTYAIDTIRELIGKKPMLGICLGHQLLGWAFGGKTFKLKFGHRGANQPVQRLDTGQVEITAQNHGFCVDIDSLAHANVELTHINLNDGTLEGMAHRDYPIFSVQYHPEASPGPHDAGYLFEKFISLMEPDNT